MRIVIVFSVKVIYNIKHEAKVANKKKLYYEEQSKKEAK